MATVKPANLAPDTLPRVRGVFLVRPWRGLYVAAKWPRKRGKPKTWRQHWTVEQFSYAGKMAANAEPMSYETARFVTEGSHWLPRDVLTMVAFGKFYEIVLPDGTICPQASHAPPDLNPPEPEWQLAAESALNNNSNGWNGYTIRQRIAAAQLLHQGDEWRVTFTAATATAGLTIGEAWIGQGAAAGHAYDFAAAPTQLHFEGAPGASCAPGETITSDGVAFSLDPGQPLLISCYFNGVTSIRTRGTLTGWQGYYRLGNTASVVDTNSYITSVAAIAVDLVETR